MVTVLAAAALLAALYVGLIYRFRSGLAFAIGVMVTLGLWWAPFLLRPSYANALYFSLAMVGSTFLGSTGALMWWRSRQAADPEAWYWLAGGALVVVPAALWAVLSAVG